MEYEGCCGSESISVTGSLSSNGATFNNQGNGSITFGPTGTISGANNTYNLPVTVPYTDVASLAGNTSFDQVLIAAGTLSSGTLTLNPIGNSTSLSYVFPNGFTVADGGTLAVSAGECLGGGRGGSDADRCRRALSFSSGDVVTMEYEGCCGSESISVTGSLSSNGATFNNNGNGYITFGSTGTISGANNTYNVPVYVPYTDVASLAGNTSFTQVEITAGTISSGTLTLNPIGNSTSLSYVFPNGFTVADGGTLAVSANVAVSVAEGQTLTDAGALSFSSGDVVTMEYEGCCGSESISVTGSLSSNGATFNNQGNGSITFGPTGTISGANNTYNLPVTVPYTDVASLAGNTSFDQVLIAAGTLSSGTLTLNPIGNSTSLSYVFPNGFTVADGGTLAVSANVAVSVAEGQTLTDAGALSFSSGDVVTMEYEGLLR